MLVALLNSTLFSECKPPTSLPQGHLVGWPGVHALRKGVDLWVLACREVRAPYFDDLHGEAHDHICTWGGSCRDPVLPAL